jgi:hypothetical protein
MLLGLDFDNTLVCYDGAFHQVARERDLVPADLPIVKEQVRDHLRAEGREDDWTELQGSPVRSSSLPAPVPPGCRSSS